MPTASYNKYTAAIEPLFEGINAGTDTWKVALAATVNAADTTFTPGTTDLATANGYTAGGNAVTVTSAAQTAGTFKLVLTSPAAWTATGAGFTFRYAILWDSTTSTPVAYWDYGSSQAVAATETVTVTLDATNGVFQAT
ncbi:hypothetical protein UFOVP254_41 [uncultured Caudovirales phage]|uniref:Uncharacterized protein n=1 Tax=uncultured Caudovirales phage TaxID=2100421 RepID=A0A6J5LEI2_9CAUD|nr:hypothetical protein UFOVP76_12 [uncultured Caudovirales phage]CAB4133078.1 hypothetical protein UFOVP254_41 [uncultured Caudovirales phage]